MSEPMDPGFAGVQWSREEVAAAYAKAEQEIPVMSEPLLADDGYPSEAELERIAGWDPADIHGWLDYVRERWRWADSGYWEQGPATLSMSTGGWSGNEDLVGAMSRNIVIWLLLWEISRRGGHYQLDLTRIPKDS